MIDGARERLQGERIVMTPLQFDNIYRHFDWNNDRELNRLDSELPYEREEFGDFKHRFEMMVFEPTADCQDFEIHTADGKLIGVAFLEGMSAKNRHCTARITIGDRDYWGKGYGRDALTTLMAYCFEDLHMHRVTTDTFEYNVAWRNLVEWAGFRMEGAARDYLFRDERYWDKRVYSLLEDEYYARFHAAELAHAV